MNPALFDRLRLIDDNIPVELSSPLTMTNPSQRGAAQVSRQ